MGRLAKHFNRNDPVKLFSGSENVYITSQHVYIGESNRVDVSLLSRTVADRDNTAVGKLFGNVKR